MYHKKDPRYALAPDTRIPKHNIKEAHTIEFNETIPIETKMGSKIWWVRGESFYLSYSSAVEGEEFIRRNQPDEYIVILPNKSTKCIVEHENYQKTVNGYSIVIIQKGNSSVRLLNDGVVIFVYSMRNQDLEDYPINNKYYEHCDQNVSGFELSDVPPNIKSIQAYSLDIPKEKNRFGRIFRSANFTISCLYPWQGQRDVKTLSPHSHYDFEQCTLAIEGEFIHHFKYPWLPDKNKWREDQHCKASTPSVTFIPPGVTHTTEAIGDQNNELIDIFCPPRYDFSEQKGWVINEEEYLT